MGSLHPRKVKQVGRGVAPVGKDMEGHGLGEPCVTGAVWEAGGASWGMTGGKHLLLPLGMGCRMIPQCSWVQPEVVLAALLCHAREGID